MMSSQESRDPRSGNFIFANLVEKLLAADAELLGVLNVRLRTERPDPRSCPWVWLSLNLWKRGKHRARERSFREPLRVTPHRA